MKIVDLRPTMILNVNKGFPDEDPNQLGEKMRAGKRINSILSGFVVWLLFLIFACQGPDFVYGQDVVWKLDLSKVEFVLITHGKFHDVLEVRALAKFADVGLPVTAGYSYPRLELTLKQRPSKYCEGIFIYLSKLQLHEEIILSRSGHKRIVTTWFMGNERGIETEPLTINDLKRDLDEMLKVFIEQYQFVNGIKTPFP